MPRTLIPIILAGGKGERFWPLSRRTHPKQFLSLDGSGASLLQATAKRLLAVSDSWDDIWVVTAAHLAEGVRQQLPQLPEENLLIEPEGRDTAPAVAWATLEASKRYGEDVVLGFFPADHWIDDLEGFGQTLAAAAELSQQEGAIATLGIKPNYPSTGYGYIEQSQDSLGSFRDLPAYPVSRFTEKPDTETAQQFLDSGRFSWNSGMFIFQAGTALKELRQHAPEILEPLEQKGVDAYPTLTKLSIDYALMEKTDKAYVLPVTFGWDDLGDWNAIERLVKQPEDQNVEQCNHVSIDSEGCILHAEDGELIATIGLDDVVVVRSGKATLIVKKERTQEIKQLLKQIKDNPEYDGLL